MQSDIELVISRFSEIEKRLVEDLGATEKNGRLRTSFTDRLAQVQHLLAPDIISRMRMIASLRNKLAHGEISTIPNKDRFLRDCEAINREIDAAKKRSSRHYQMATPPAFSSDRLDFSVTHKPFRMPKHLGKITFFILILLYILFQNRTSSVTHHNAQEETVNTSPTPESKPNKSQNTAKLKKKTAHKKAKKETNEVQIEPNLKSEAQEVAK